MRRLALLMIAVTLVATGCSSRAPKRPLATAPPVSAPPVSSNRMDVSGKWAGKWIGYGIVDIPRNEDATAELYQRGSHGYGRIVFDGADAAESVPISLRHGGLTGARVQFDISGSSLTMKHELGGQGFAIDFKVDEVITSVTTLTAQKAHEKGLEFLAHVSPGIPEHLLGDPLRLGDNVLVGPRAYLTGCTVADNVFLATGTAVFTSGLGGSCRRSTTLVVRRS